MSPPRITVIGSVNLDFVVEVPQLPSPGETVMGRRFKTAPGGKGANQALAARRLGAEVALLARVGDDAYADEALAGLVRDGVSLRHIARTCDAPTGAAFISVDAAGENQIAVASGANLNLTVDDVAALPSCDVLLAQLEVPQAAILAAAACSSAFLALNAAPAVPLEPDLIARTDLLIVNTGEYASLKDDLRSYEGQLAITQGEAGAVLLQMGKEIARACAPKVEVRDTTGAGDCFCGALTVALAEGLDPVTALEWASMAGALATTRLGAQAALPWRSELEEFIAALRT